MAETLTPERLRNEPIHATNCRRYIEGLQNTTAKDCTCFVGEYADAWEAEQATTASHLVYCSEHRTIVSVRPDGSRWCCIVAADKVCIVAMERKMKAEAAYFAMIRRQSDHDVEPMPIAEQRAIEDEQIAAHKAYTASLRGRDHA